MTRISLILSLSVATSALAETVSVNSPDGTLSASFSTETDGLSWSLRRKGETLVAPSRLGLVLSEWTQPFGAAKIIAKRERSSDTSWQTRLYRRATVRDRYNELAVDLEEEAAPHRRMGLVFRAYEEGVAFRYVVPAQPGLPGFQLLRELTEYRFAEDPQVWATCYKTHQTSQEEPFRMSALSAVSESALVGMPLLVRTRGQSLALTEAALVNWAGAFYRMRGATPEGGRILGVELSPLPKSAAATDGVAVIRTTPAESPWRVAICADDDLGLLRNNDIVPNLNPPPEAGQDFGWVKAGASGWDWWYGSNNALSTERTLEQVDFAAEMGWPYHTVDGGWYGFARRPNHGPDVRLEPRPGFDLAKVVARGREKGVGIWVWIHWELIDDTGIEETFARLERWGVAGVKTDFLDRQDQKIVNWCERVCRAAAKHRILVNFHGAFKPTGTERTWPNNLTREGVLGNEMTKFRADVTPEHAATLPFTRFLIGPGDFTPGSFANVFAKDFVPQAKRGHRYGDETDRRPIWAEEIGTRAHALALCVAYDSPLMTLCDAPERYRGADGVAALRGLPASWKATTPVAGVCGEHYAVVRETHDGRFYFAALTAKRRNVDLKLDFLGDGEWRMSVFADDPELTPGDAKALATGSRKVRRGERIGFGLWDGGGAVAVFEPL